MSPRLAGNRTGRLRPAETRYVHQFNQTILIGLPPVWRNCAEPIACGGQRSGANLERPRRTARKKRHGGVILVEKQPNPRTLGGAEMRSIGPELLASLFREHGTGLLLYARQFGVGRAEDLVQEAFVRLASQRRIPEPMLPWLYRVVRNEAISTARRQARRRKYEERAARPESWFASADRALEASEATEALAGLPLDQREAIVARIWGGLGLDEIALLVGCSTATAHRRYHAGLTSLRTNLEDRWIRTSSQTRS